MNKNATNLILFAVILVSIASPALAQEIFEPVSSFLEQIKTFVTGTNGILLGGAAIAVAGISAAAPRIPVSWGHFFVVLVVLTIFFGAFKIAEVIQNFAV
ncbi:TrbC/VirB2 family protein [Pelagibius sp. Alg239-R121]|uniref:TrbC/VirB2 family protein n=1 Tax=Pelagibius sp. Alg239-R121 TaxID=2993448 RepID=UPI0024A628A7|nr:TrbC/VirB2 family protein [Pelagibius sp. Alg239-R121]